jgi:hypothetical protein
VVAVRCFDPKDHGGGLKQKVDAGRNLRWHSLPMNIAKASIIDGRINTGLKVLIAAYLAAYDIFITFLV